MADPKPLPPSALAEGESAAMQAGIINASTLEKDTAAKDGLKGEKVEGNTKKKTDEGMKNYIRVFSYGTALDFFLIALCCITSIGSGIAFPLMNVVFGTCIVSLVLYVR
jgi:hypothetical protein